MMATASICPPINESERKIVREFIHLLEKSKQLFNGLRDLPAHGTKHWQTYFGRTFDIYTRLWKFQQQHRPELDVHYGLKRWQIGEIASKIGQLYYHYYLRTSETGYLLEAFSFYFAIRSRAYYSKAAKEERLGPDLMIKKLRYYARFVVVCLLLKKLKLVRDLIRELSRHVDEYVTVYDQNDHLEWHLVLTEIKSFVEADNIVNIVDVDSSTVILSHRLTPYNSPPTEKGIPTVLTLQEVFIIGNTFDQVKYSELTLDMYWMLQALEREPHEQEMLSVNRSIDASPAPGKSPYDDASKPENPHKYLLYKPSFAQLYLFLSTGLKELPPKGAILVYISADGVFADPSRSRTSANPAYDYGGVVTTDRKDDTQLINETTANLNRKNVQLKDPNCLYPGDLYPFVRKPFFLIVDSDNSSVFLGLPNLFGQPLVVLASPEESPPYLQEQPCRGSLLTLFLHSPLTAFCYICNIADIPIALWDKCQTHIDKFLYEAGRFMVRCPAVDRSYIEFYGDEFLRLLLLRFIFCHAVLRLHRSFRVSPGFHPHCSPPLPELEVLLQPGLTRQVLDLACILDVMAAFRESDETVC